MPRDNPETHFKRAVIDSYDGFVSRIEYGRGGDPGVPDLLLGTIDGWLPAEVKVGTIEDGVLWTSKIRPSQLKFARESSAAGFPAIFLVGIQDATKWRCFVFNAVLANQFDSIGFAIDKDCIELHMNNLAEEIDNFIVREFDE